MELRMKSNFHKDIIFSSPIRVRRMGEGRVGVTRSTNLALGTTDPLMRWSFYSWCQFPAE
jgi:hypothetical protein